MTTIFFTNGEPIADFICNYVVHVDSTRRSAKPETIQEIVEKFRTAGFLAANLIIPQLLAVTDLKDARQIHAEVLACACHETNRAYCRFIGDDSQQPWKDVSEWQRTSAVQSVRFRLENPSATPELQHEAWMRDKEKDGWKFGPVKDPEKKEHPCLVPYDELSYKRQVKDHIFSGILQLERAQMDAASRVSYDPSATNSLKEKDLFAPGQADARQTDEPTVSPGAALFRPRYRKLSEDELALHDALKSKAGELAELFYRVAPVHEGHVPDREKGANVQLAVRHLEDAVYRAVKALTA